MILLNVKGAALKLWTIGALITLVLSGCGFQLRGTGQHSLQQHTVSVISQTPYGELEKKLKRDLQAAGAQLLDYATANSEQITGQYIQVNLLNLEVEEQGTSRDATGRANEITLRFVLDYQIMSGSAELIDDAEADIRQLKVSRSYYQNFTSPVSDTNLRRQTSEDIYAELSRRLTQQISRFPTSQP